MPSTDIQISGLKVQRAISPTGGWDIWLEGPADFPFKQGATETLLAVLRARGHFNR